MHIQHTYVHINTHMFYHVRNLPHVETVFKGLFETFIIITFITFCVMTILYIRFVILFIELLFCT